MGIGFKEKLKRLREARENNRLVIFVGAGVSNNSGIPGWHELIKCFAKKLNIDKCNKCSFRNSSNCPPDCKEKYNFCQDDYLKIPQYFYNEKESDYFNIIKEIFNVRAKPNKINDMIMDLQPKHIITTNFDKLIENTENLNKMIYKVVTKDEDLLIYHSNNSYIIKMHGDIDKIKDVVLKEEDYLDYSRKHILIETFIKSLLVDHIFLFIGYSLNDYNLKLIINWLEYLARDCNKDERQNNYILVEHKKKYMDRYFSKNNIITISAREIPKIIKKRYSNIMPKKMGMNICALLECILDTGSDYLLEPLPDVLHRRYQIFKNRKRISYEELKQYHYFGSLKRKGSEIKLSDKSEFDSIKEVLKDKSKKAEFIKKILLKAGIEKVSNESSSVRVKVSDYRDSYSELLKLDQQNRYKDVISKAETMNDEITKLYYIYLITPSHNELSESMKKIEKELLNSDDYFKLLVFKFNNYCLLKFSTWRSDSFREVDKVLKNIPVGKKRSYSYLEKIFEGNYYNIIRCKELADKCIKTYTDINTTYYGEIKNIELLELQAISYDYYYYFKINNLIIDRFTNPKNFLEPYVKSMLCTYFPQEKKISALFGLKSNPPKRHLLNSTDLDIIVKYTNLDKLKTFLRDYRVEGLRFEKNVSINEALENLCKSVAEFPKGILASYLNAFLFILTNCSSKDFNVNVAANSISELLSNKHLISKNILSRIFDGQRSFFEIYGDIIDKTLLEKVLKSFLNRETIDYCVKNHLYLESFFRLFSRYPIGKIGKNVDKLINEKDETKEKMGVIHLLLPLFNEKQKNIYSTYLKNNIKSIPIGHLYNYISKEYLEYKRDIEEKYLKFLKEEVDERKKKPGVRTMPDYLLKTIDELIILFLLGKIRSLRKFICYSKYSEHLAFLLDPEGFDFSGLQSLDYMWENFLRNKKYRKIIVKEGTEIKENLEKAVQNGRATENQKAMLYGYFLSEEEKYKYI